MSVLWEAFQRELRGVEGSLPDLTIAGVTFDDWQWLLDEFHSGTWAVAYSEDGEASPLPELASTVFERGRDVTQLASVQLDGIQLNCHFWATDEIDFDVDPRQMAVEADFEVLCQFIRWLGSSLKQAVVLSHEGSQDAVILRYTPEGDQFELG